MIPLQIATWAPLLCFEAHEKEDREREYEWVSYFTVLVKGEKKIAEMLPGEVKVILIGITTFFGQIYIALKINLAWTIHKMYIKLGCIDK